MTKIAFFTLVFDFFFFFGFCDGHPMICSIIIVHSIIKRIANKGNKTIIYLFINLLIY